MYKTGHHLNLTMLSVWGICASCSRNLRLPLVSICQQLLLVVQKLLSCFSGILGIWSYKRLVSGLLRRSEREHTLNNGIDRATLLAETAVNALGHVDVVSRSPPATIHTLFSLDCDSLSWANGLAELAGNATLLASRITSQSMLASEAG